MNPKTLKISSSFILLAVALAFAAEGRGIDVLDNFTSITPYDSHAWAVLLLCLALAQMYLLRCADCHKCRLWGDFLLQFSGLILLIIGSAFISVYPPFSSLMGVFPILGLLFVFTGRMLARQTRRKVRGNHE